MDRTLRSVGAALVLGNGAIHLQRWFDSYREIPRMGTLFLANVVLAAVIAAALVIRPTRLVEAAGVVFSLGTLYALAIATADKLYGFTETSGDGYVTAAVAVELAAAAVLGAALVRRLRRDVAALPAPA